MESISQELVPRRFQGIQLTQSRCKALSVVPLNMVPNSKTNTSHLWIIQGKKIDTRLDSSSTST